LGQRGKVSFCIGHDTVGKTIRKAHIRRTDHFFAASQSFQQAHGTPFVAGGDDDIIQPTIECGQILRGQLFICDDKLHKVQLAYLLEQIHTFTSAVAAKAANEP
jgi:hypothetical protein